MADYIIDGTILTDIANAVREKTGVVDAIIPENMASTLRSTESGYEQGYAAGNADGYAKGLSDGRASLDILPSIELAPWGAYYGKTLDSFGDQKLILLFTLKKGKTVPSGSLGHIRQPKTGGTTAAWVVSGGEYRTAYRYVELTPSDYETSVLGCYPGTKETWDAFMDAFEVRAELIQEEI